MDDRPTVDDALLGRIREVCRYHNMYVVKKRDYGETCYLVYRKHPNENVKLGIKIGRRSTVNGLRLFVNKLILESENHVKP
jgi:hypothetical protein